MPSSSTSDSDHDAMARVPASARVRTLLLTACLVAAMLAGWESWVRFRASVEDRPEAKSVAAMAVSRPAKDGNNRVFLLGSSRMQMGADSETIEGELGAGWEVHNLALPMGSSALQFHMILKSVREGDVIVLGVLPQSFYTDAESPDLEGFGAKLPTTFGPAGLDLWISVALQEHVWFLRGHVSPAEEAHRVLRALVVEPTPNDSAQGKIRAGKNGWLELQLEPGATFSSDYDLDFAQRLERSIRPDRAQLFDNVLGRLQEDVDDARGAGAREIFFVRLPSDHEFAAAEERYYPRTEYWDKLAATYPQRCWHFADNPTTRTLPTVDGSHLAGPDALRYSHWLGQRLREALKDGGQ